MSGFASSKEEKGETSVPASALEDAVDHGHDEDEDPLDTFFRINEIFDQGGFDVSQPESPEIARETMQMGMSTRPCPTYFCLCFAQVHGVVNLRLFFLQESVSCLMTLPETIELLKNNRLILWKQKVIQ